MRRRSAPFETVRGTWAACTGTTSGRSRRGSCSGTAPGYARYDYLGGSGVWSPRLSITVPLDGFRVKALASRRALVPGAEEFAPSVTGVWLPPERTFSSLARDGRFTAGADAPSADVASSAISRPASLCRCAASISASSNQLIEIFDAVPGRAEAPLGHYYVATAGNIDARGWGAAMTHEVPGYVRGTIEYTVTTAYWDPASDMSIGARGSVASGEREREDARPADVNRSDDPADRDARVRDTTA